MTSVLLVADVAGEGDWFLRDQYDVSWPSCVKLVLTIVLHKILKLPVRLAFFDVVW